ncbi:ArsR family transcriptional regulator [Mycobacterium heckeshornense]|uniref:MarR family transcriptional regulator n=1 Tax=Mycobacterium heckeshornense TaxID=110505 RepID=A0A2G8BCW7_9MYCO|nr:MarR family transcriptional regulator [Mycobacterium heckeshornense]KMV20847.1 ArsR family transcriptional regulator [Mycobacterium heckeshornense]MCV7032978.1 MarR family transcriptional regulator [Mycobacterium heckeshornense]PIJ35611.1 ArsR family transcriptional regulator [Mycobacterium heckeshornense]BCO35734.1 MarR family transcriptional regulator [Mycobacterium heckeshornense]
MTNDVEGWPIGRLLSTAARLLEHSWEERLREHNLTHAGLIALYCLQNGPMSQRSLAAACRVTDQTISRTIERLERSGFITRRVDPDDERRQQVTITREGRVVLTRIVATRQADALVEAAVSEPETLRRQLIELIRAMGSPT